MSEFWHSTRQRQEIDRQAQLTERYSRAVDQLGSGKVDVRLGGIYALERLALDSPRDHPVVMEVLTAFVREHSHDALESAGSGSPGGHQNQQPAPRADIQAAITVIGRRIVAYDKGRLDLSGSYLAGADFSREHGRAEFSEANFNNVNLDGANLSRAKLSKAYFIGAHMDGADLSHAVLSNANLTRAVLTGAIMDAARLDNATLVSAKLSQVFLGNADLTGANLVGATLTGASLDDATLAQANMTRTDVTESQLTAARLLNAIIEPGKVPPGWILDKDSDRLVPLQPEFGQRPV